MPNEHRQSRLTRSQHETSMSADEQDEAQLSVPDGVESDVSSIAINRGMLAMSSSPAALDTGADAEVMLRVKGGDESAFAYLVQKYRRPMVSFMYRMARSSAAAEDLAQEVFL